MLEHHNPRYKNFDSECKFKTKDQFSNTHYNNNFFSNEIVKFFKAMPL